LATLTLLQTLREEPPLTRVAGQTESHLKVVTGRCAMLEA
jgi:hypothetical protein